jgi:hypothetical protein
MNKTIIHSCTSDVTSGTLAGFMTRKLGITSMRTIWFPEVRRCGRFSFPPYIPFHESELSAVALNLIGRRIVTVSEIIILTFLREVRKGRMRTDEIELWAVYKDGDHTMERKIDVDIKGITRWNVRSTSISRDN